MGEIVESYKKVFRNKKVNICLFITAILWVLISTFLDLYFSPNDQYQLCCLIDLIFYYFIGVYSVLFLHNAIHNINNGEFPSIKEINAKIAWGVIKISIIWAGYILLATLFAFVAYIATHILAVPIILLSLVPILAVGIYYITLALADKYSSKGLWKPSYLFKFIKAAYKPLYTNLCLFLMITLLAIVIFVLIYAVAYLIGINEIGQITNDLYFMDIIMDIIATYIGIITWSFAFPYSLISSYNEYVKPIYEEGEQ